jgi:prevent-host-death family protein
MDEVAISEFKAKCLAILERVRLTKTPIRVVRFGKPVADVVPPAVTVMDRSQWIGSMKDSIEVLGDIVSPANDEDDWEVLRD